MLDQLTNYLRAQLPDARDLTVSNLERKSGGASRETWAFTATWTAGRSPAGGDLILRRDPTGGLLESDRAREFQVLQALYGSGIPLPRTYWLELSGDWLERPFFVMERVAGQATVGTLPPGYPAEVRAHIAEQFIAILARLHRLDWNTLGLNLDAPPVGGGAARVQLNRWRAIYDQNALEPVPLIEEAFLWLCAHIPSTDYVTLVHGDYRSGNYLFTNDGTITAMLDWEMAHLGDPMEDLGWACMKFWRNNNLVGGLMPRGDFLEGYARAGGIAVDEPRVFFYEVLGTVKMAVIALTGARALCDGTTHEASMPVVTFFVPRLLRDLVDQLDL